MDLKSAIKNINDKSVNNYIRDHYSYLNWAVKENDVLSINFLLENGANPNGITSNGITSKIPLTSISFRSDKFDIIVRLLLKNGADINQDDLRGYTILTLYFDFMFGTFNYQNEKFIDILYFLLERGANPNGTIFYNPLSIIVNSLHEINKKYHHIVYKISEILIAYGANPNFETITLKINSNNERKTANKLLNSYSNKSSEYNLLNKLFNITIEDIINDCSSSELLTSLSKYYKIEYNGSDKSRKELCKCIKKINKNKESYDEDTFIEYRKKLREYKREECSNEDLLIGSSVDSFPPNELVYLKETSPNFTYCFHLSEISMLLSTRKNPYNNRPLSSTFLDDLVTKYKYFIPKTLEEVLDNVFEFNLSTITIGVLIEKLSMYIKSFNSYIQTEKLLEINTWQLVELQNMLYGGNNDVILSMTNYIDRNFGLVGESNTDSKNRILERTITHLILYVTNNLDGIPFMANVVDQLLKDVETSIRIVDLFPKSKKRDIVIYSKTIRYSEFIKNFYRIVIRNINDLPLVINDPKFRNYLSDDQKNVIDYLEPSEVINIYVEYIKSSIEVILKERFGEIDINNSWDDIVPGFSLVTL
jgi:hypothetical protein